jgi:hypothetical protein
MTLPHGFGNAVQLVTISLDVVQRIQNDKSLIVRLSPRTLGTGSIKLGLQTCPRGLFIVRVTIAV